MSISLRDLILALFAAVFITLTSAIPNTSFAEDSDPATVFGGLPIFSSPQLSPDGKYLAVVQPIDGFASVKIWQLEPQLANTGVFVGNDKYLIRSVRWGSNDRVIVTFDQNTSRRGDSKLDLWTKAVAISTNAKNSTLLISDVRIQSMNSNTAQIVDTTPDEPGHILMSAFQYINAYQNLDSKMAGNIENAYQLGLYSVDLATGKEELVGSATNATREWLTDGAGNPVARVDRSRSLQETIYRYDGKNDWTSLMSYDAHQGGEASLEGLSMDGTAIVLNSLQNGNTQGLWALDLATGKLGKEPIASNPKYDIDRSLLDPWTNRVIGYHYVDDMGKSAYFDPAMQKIQTDLEAKFPGLEVEILSFSTDKNVFLASVSGSRHPETLEIYKVQSATVIEIGQAYLNMDTATLGETKSYTYKARDGVEIPAYLTLPPKKEAKNLPTVILPHGGPELRDDMNFDYLTEFLAHQGYAVLRPNFRGSNGYGLDFAAAGFQQWGLRMQDDVTDGVKQLIADGIADPKKICILGDSYGGYAAMAGAAFTPDLYACAIAASGVFDLQKILNDKASGEDVGASYWQSRIGLRFADSVKLRATSPALHADQVQAPVLLIHGTKDTTVSISQSIAMETALKKANKGVTFVKIEGDDHYWSTSKTRTEMLRAIDAFLGKHIGN